MRSKRQILRAVTMVLAAGALGACATSHPQTQELTPEPAPAAQASQPLPDQGAQEGGEKLSGKEDEATRPNAAPAPAASPAEQAAFSQAVEAAGAGDAERAIAVLERALAGDVKLYWAQYDLGALYERKGQSGPALDAYRKALDVKPDFGDAALAEARLLRRLGRLSEVEGDLRSRIAQHPKALGLQTALVFTLVQEGQLDPAAAEAKKVLKSDERNVDAMFQLASIYYKQGKNELALMVLDNAKAIHPQDPLIHNALGFVHIALDQKPLALEDFKRAAALSPDFAEAHNNLGVLLNEAQDYPGAVKELEQAVRDAPDFVAARLNLGNAYRGDKQYEHALQAYQKVLELDPKQRDAYFNLAVLYFDGDFPNMNGVDRFNKALAYFDQYEQAGGNDPKVDQYRKDAGKLIAKEKRRMEIEARDKLRKAQKAAAEKANQDAEKAKKAQQQPASPLPGGGVKLSDQQPAAPQGGKLQGGKLGGGDEK